MNLKDSSLGGLILVYWYIEFQDRTWVEKEKKSLCASLGRIVRRIVGGITTAFQKG